jgi:ADP-ribose pyrophosphatase YjhB (NUDIX family)
MKTKILVIGIVRKSDNVLMRKKPEGSLPYKETWYLFGGELTPDKSPEKAIQENLKKMAGIKIRLIHKLDWDTEIKKDIDGEEKFFIYLDTVCEYISGDLKPAQGIEKLEWIPVSKLKDYDIVPPANKLFRKLKYLD